MRPSRNGPRFAIGATLGLAVIVIGPLTGGGFNPARAFGPALVSGEFGGAGNFLLAYVARRRCSGAAGGGVRSTSTCTSRPGKKGTGGMEPVG